MRHSNSDKEFFKTYREEFPITKNLVYLDHAAVSPVSLRVKKAVNDFLTEAVEYAFFNYGSWLQRVEDIRGTCAKLVGSERDEIAFIKNTSHGLSLVAQGLDWREGDNLITYEREFPSNVYPWLSLKRRGVSLRFIPFKGYGFHTDEIENLIDTRTRLLSISSVQFTNGFRCDIQRIAELCKKKGVLLFIDAIQSLGAIPLDVKELGIDFLAADGHKWLLAPEGTGIFYCRNELGEILYPSLIGWKSVINEHDYDQLDFVLKNNALKFEEGSFNVVGITALGAAIEILLGIGIERIERRILELGDLIIEETAKRPLELRSPGDRKERSGIHSIAGNFDPKVVKDKLKALGIIVNVRGGALRVAPHFYNTEEEILKFFAALDSILESKF